MEKWINILNQCPIFKCVSNDEILALFQEISYYMEEFEKNRIIYHEQETSNRIGIILWGCLEMRKYLPNGNVLSIFQRKQKEMLGGSIVFSSNPVYPCEVITKEKSLILWIERDVLFELFSKNRTIASNILKISADRIMQLEKRVELFSFYSIQKKIAFSLLNDFSINESYTISLPFSKTTWSEYLNVSRTSLSRELKNLSDQKIIKMDKNQIMILQKDLLEAILY